MINKFGWEDCLKIYKYVGNQVKRKLINIKFNHLVLFQIFNEEFELPRKKILKLKVMVYILAKGGASFAPFNETRSKPCSYRVLIIFAHDELFESRNI